MKDLTVKMRASEALVAEKLPEHLDIDCWDALTEQFFAMQRLVDVISLDLQRIGINDDDVIALARCPFLPNLRWLSLVGNRISDLAVREICRAIQGGWFDLNWLDLVGTDYDATIYLDGGDENEAYWRLPKASNDLRKEFGLQYWMTIGFPLEEEYKKLVPIETCLKKISKYEKRIKTGL